MTETQIIGGVITDPSILDEVIDEIKSEWFTDPLDKVWSLIEELYENNIPVETSTLYELNLKKKFNLSPTTFSDYGMTSSANVPYYAKVLKEKYMAKQAIKLNKETEKKIELKEDIFETIEGQISSLMDVTESKVNNSELVNTVTSRVVEHIDRIHSGKGQGFWVDSGYYDLDDKVKLMNKNLIIVAARPSMGKTALILNIARNIGAKDYVGIFSLEMSNEEVTTRLISTESGLSYLPIITGQLKQEDGGEIARASQKVKDLKIVVDDTSPLTPMELMVKARRMKKKYDIKILFIDYIGLMHQPDLRTMREREISYISGRMKSLAKDLGIPVVLLSQLNRSVESRTDKRPQLSDLRDSGSIEQDADSVIFLYRPEYYGLMTDKDGNPTDNLCELIIAKNRNGATGSVNLRFESKTMTFKNMSLI